MSDTILKDIEFLKIATEKYFDDHYNEATKMLEDRPFHMIYSKIGHSMILLMKCILSFDEKDVAEALETTRKIYDQSERMRLSDKSGSNLLTLVKSSCNYTNCDLVQLHSEIIYATSLLIISILEILFNEGLTDIMKAGVRILNAHKILKAMYKQYQENKDQMNHILGETKTFFNLIMELSYGVFNLTVAVVPPKLLKYMNFIGIKGDLKVGIQKLTFVFDSESILCPLAGSIIAMFHFQIKQIFGYGFYGCGPTLESIISKLKVFYPNFTFFKYQEAKYLQLEGCFEETIKLCEEIVKKDLDWPKAKNIVYWELTWCYAMTHKINLAKMYVDILLKESLWSKSTFYYMKGTIQMMQDDITKSLEIKNASQNMQSLYKNSVAIEEDVEVCFGNVKPHLKKILGKAVPQEKFVNLRATDYLKNKVHAWNFYELVYIYKRCPSVAKNDVLRDQYIKELIETIKITEVLPEMNIQTYYCKLIILSLMATSGMNSVNFDSFTITIEDLGRELINSKKKLGYNMYIMTSAAFELAVYFYNLNQMNKCEEYRNIINSVSKDYVLESMMAMKLYNLDLLIQYAEK